MASVVVVGGGLAGLVCAWRLRRSGHSVEVLERAETAGGGACTGSIAEAEGFLLPGAVARMAAADRNLRAVSDALGLPSHARETRACLAHAGRLYPADLGRPLAMIATSPLSLRARARLVAAVPALWRAAGDPSADGTALDTGLRQLAGREAAETLLGPALAHALGCAPDRVSLRAGMQGLRRAFAGPASELVDGAGDALPSALSRAVPVRTGCTVTQVETEGGGARVRYTRSGSARSVVADAVVIALPPDAVLRLCPKLAPDERGFLESVCMAPRLRVQVLLDTPPPVAASSVALTSGPLRGVSCDHVLRGAAPPGAGNLCAVLRDAAVRVPDNELVAHVCAALAATPFGRLRPLRSIVRRDTVPEFAPGHLTRAARFAERVERSPRLAFAGAYRVGPHAEGAATSGMRAADAVARML